MNKYIFPIIILTIIIIIVIVFILFHKNYNIKYDDITNDNYDITNENYNITNENEDITNENYDIINENEDMINENDDITNENNDDIIENFSSTCEGAKNLGCFAGGDNWWRNKSFCENPLTLGLNWHLVNKEIIDTGEYNEYVNINLAQHIKSISASKIILNQETYNSLGINRSDLTYKSYIKIDNGVYYIPTPENALLCFIKRLFCMITVQKCDKELLNKTIDQLRTAKNDLDGKVTELDNNIKSLSANLRTTNTNKQTIQSELDGLKTTHQTLIDTKEALEATLDQVRKNLETKTSEKNASDRRITELETSLSQTESELNTANTDISDLQSEIQGLNDEIDSLNSEKTTLTGRISALEKAAQQRASADAAQGQLFSDMWSGLMSSTPPPSSPPSSLPPPSSPPSSLPPPSSPPPSSPPPSSPPSSLPPPSSPPPSLPPPSSPPSSLPPPSSPPPSLPSPKPVEPKCIINCSILEQKILSDYKTEYMGPDSTKNTGYDAKNIRITNMGMSEDKGFCKIDYDYEKNPDHWPPNPGSGSGRRTYRFKLLNDDPCEWDFDTYQNTGKNYTVAQYYGGELNYVERSPPAPPPVSGGDSGGDGGGNDNLGDDDWDDDFGDLGDEDSDPFAQTGSPSPPPAPPVAPPPVSPPPPAPAADSGILAGNDDADLAALAALGSGNSGIDFSF